MSLTAFTGWEAVAGLAMSVLPFAVGSELIKRANERSATYMAQLQEEQVLLDHIYKDLSHQVWKESAQQAFEMNKHHFEKHGLL